MIDADEQVLLVGTDGVPTGLTGKLEAHRSGLLHLAISAFVFDGRGRTLLQLRQRGKYHSAGQRTNACCSHPRAGETPLACAERRLLEEMGFACPLTPVFQTVYEADVGSGLREHEFVHVFAGQYDGAVRPDRAEADGYQWMTLGELKSQVGATPEKFTPWLRIYLADHYELLATAANSKL